MEVFDLALPADLFLRRKGRSCDMQCSRWNQNLTLTDSTCVVYLVYLDGQNAYS
jgi:hypothetical protein